MLKRPRSKFWRRKFVKNCLWNDIIGIQLFSAIRKGLIKLRITTPMQIFMPNPNIADSHDWVKESSSFACLKLTHESARKFATNRMVQVRIRCLPDVATRFVVADESQYFRTWKSNYVGNGRESTTMDAGRFCTINYCWCQIWIS